MASSAVCRAAFKSDAGWCHRCRFRGEPVAFIILDISRLKRDLILPEQNSKEEIGRAGKLMNFSFGISVERSEPQFSGAKFSLELSAWGTKGGTGKMIVSGKRIVPEEGKFHCQVYVAMVLQLLKHDWCRLPYSPVLRVIVRFIVTGYPSGIRTINQPLKDPARSVICRLRPNRIQSAIIKRGEGLRSCFKSWQVDNYN